MNCARMVNAKRVRCATSRRASRAGLSLLEVIIALAVLAGSAAVIAQMVEMAVRRSARSDERTEAATLCHNLMNELVAGVRPWQNMTSPQPVDLFSPWDYQVTVEPLGFADLAALTVVVSRRAGVPGTGVMERGVAGVGAAAISPPPASPAADNGDGASTIAARDSRPTYRWSRWVRASLPNAGRDSRTMSPDAATQDPDAATQDPGGFRDAPMATDPE